MDKNIFELTNKVAYFLWDLTNHENALDIWYCAEDIASFFERMDLIDKKSVEELIISDKKSERYVFFIRNIAFRIYIYTNCCDDIKNWFLTEHIVENKEWIEALLKMSGIYKENKGTDDLKRTLKSNVVKDYYYPFNQKA